MADLRPAIRSTNISLVNAGIDGVRPEPAGQVVSGVREDGSGPAAHVVEFDTSPVIEGEGVTRVPHRLVVRSQYDKPAGHAHVQAEHTAVQRQD